MKTLLVYVDVFKHFQFLVDLLIARLSCEQFLGFSLLRKGQKLRFKGLAEDPQSVTDPVLVSYKEIKSTTLR